MISAIKEVFCTHAKTTSSCDVVLLLLYKTVALETMPNVHLDMETRTMSQHCLLLHQPLSACFMQSRNYFLFVPLEVILSLYINITPINIDSEIIFCVIVKAPITFLL
jgi:hypothetical protein